MFEFIGKSLTLIAFGLASPFGFNIGIEEPQYRVVETLNNGIEIREYGNRIAAETTAMEIDPDKASSEGFKIIAGYIFGKNKNKQSIAMTSPVEINSKGKSIEMTSPVEVKSGSGSMVMRFFMPANYTMETLPLPTDSRVKLVELPKIKQAVFKFTGSTSNAAITAKTNTLLEGIKSSRWSPAGPTSAYLYNAPWTIPFLRTNEVLVEVAPK